MFKSILAHLLGYLLGRSFMKLNIHRFILRLLNGVITCIEVIAIVVVVLYAGYSLWDNQQVYDSVSNLQNELLAFKPAEEDDAPPSFDELHEINADICAWLTMDGTRIDYPVLQGPDNWYYLSRNVYQETDLAGSIYLDFQNDFALTDAYNLLHGHHMNQGRMFGDLDLYKQEQFFRETATGTLLTPACMWQLDVIAYLPVKSTDDVIFAPQRYTEDASAVLDYAETLAIHLHAETLAAARETGAPLLALATCSPESSDARTIILCMMTRVTEGGAAQ